MSTFVQRMIQRYHDQVFQRMTPERRARKLFLMKALARESLRLKKNKENEDPHNNNMASLPFNFKHSTPIKNQQITNLDSVESETELKMAESYSYEESETEIKETTEPLLVVAKIYDLESVEKSVVVEEANECGKEEEERSDVSKVSEKIQLEKDEEHWKSLEILDQTAEYEFCRSLEESKQSLSTTSLLEEIEADLPSQYSLTRPLNHTFHTLASYRTRTRLARMELNQTCPVIAEQRESLDGAVVTRTKDYLETQMMVQKALAKQAEKALILSKAQKFLGIEHLESEKTLLLANLRLTAAERELEKFKTSPSSPSKENFGHIIISDLSFTVQDLKENDPGKFICVATERETVQSTFIVSEIVNNKLEFYDPFVFSNLTKDFVIQIELFRLHYKEAKKTMLTASIVKKLKKITAVNLNKSLTNSSENSGFICVACAHLRLHQISTRTGEKCSVDFSQIPLYPVLESSVELSLRTGLIVSSEQKGFLNVFKETWHRRWYSHCGYFLKCWMYPEDQESNKVPLDSIDLAKSASEIKAASLEICIRPNSFVIISEDGRKKILFSADSPQEMSKWISRLNSTIEDIRLWKPDR